MVQEDSGTTGVRQTILRPTVKEEKMKTRIFNADCSYRVKVDSKRKKGYQHWKATVVAKDALDAIHKLEIDLRKEEEYEWEDDVNPKKKHHVKVVDFDPINVTLAAEAD
jgi:hypothetical protein